VSERDSVFDQETDKSPRDIAEADEDEIERHAASSVSSSRSRQSPWRR
jgi:hypothetical protein